MQAGPKWLFRSDFPSCSESAEIWHVYSFCVKKCPGFVFQECRKIWTKLCEIQYKVNSPVVSRLSIPLSPSKDHEGGKSRHSKAAVSLESRVSFCSLEMPFEAKPSGTRDSSTLLFDALAASACATIFSVSATYENWCEDRGPSWSPLEQYAVRVTFSASSCSEIDEKKLFSKWSTSCSFSKFQTTYTN